MHMGLSQMEARSLIVKLQQKFTSTIGVALNKGPQGKGKITETAININRVTLRIGAPRKKNLKSAIQEIIN